MRPALLAVLLAVLLAPLSCRTEREGTEGPGRSAAGTVHLTYWPAPNAEEVQIADSVVAAWNRLHPDILVEMQPIPVSQSTEEVLLAAIAGRTTPDVCSNIWPGALHDYTQAGGLIPLDNFPDFQETIGTRTPRELLETFRSTDGHWYQVPWKTNPVMMFYNEALLERAGIDGPPATYSQYLEGGARIAAAFPGGEIWMGERDIRPIWWQRLFDFYPFYVAASGGRTLFQRGVVAPDTAAAAAVMAFFQTCYGRSYFPRTFFQGGDPFLLGKKATHFAGPWNVATIAKFAPGLRFGVAPLPVPDTHSGPVYSYGDYKNIAIFSNSRHPREAWEFVKFLVSVEHDLMLLTLANQIPVRGDLLENPLFSGYFRKNPLMVKFAQQAPYTRGVDAAPDLKEIFDALSQVYERCAVYGRQSPEEGIREAVRRTRLIVEWNQ